MNHVTLCVKNITKSFDFYHQVLGLSPLCKWDRGAYFLVGCFWFCLNVDEVYPPSEANTHYAFSVSSENFQSMKKRILDSGSLVYKENTSPGDSLYFLDPDGHKLEIHVADWKARIAIKKLHPEPWKDITWFV